MASNRFFTIMIVPEKTQQVKKFIVPNYIVKGAAGTLAFVLVLAVIMILDYANVMNQITENKRLKIENRQLRQAVQVFKDKIVTIENTLDRVKTFATKLRIITNIEEQPGQNAAPMMPAQPASPPSSLPSSDQTSNGGASAFTPPKESLSSSGIEADTDEEAASIPAPSSSAGTDSSGSRARRKALLASLMRETPETLTLSDADTSLFVKTEFEKLDTVYEEVNVFAMAEEQEAQYILEKLEEKRAIIAGTPTRLPTLGYITSDYGVRISPYDSRRKMHEGIDIANRYGADIVAPANGMVLFAGNKPGFGKVVVLDHGNGIETYFAHLSRFTVRMGDRVRRGQRIASVGSSGHATGPHLHYEVRANGLPVDPCWYILDSPTLCRSR